MGVIYIDRETVAAGVLNLYPKAVVSINIRQGIRATGRDGFGKDGAVISMGLSLHEKLSLRIRGAAEKGHE